MKATAEDVKLAKHRAAEWKEFRRKYLYNQRHLAQSLRCSLRTVSAIEGAESLHPSVEVLRRFRDLKLRMERLYPQVTPVRNDEHVSQRSA